MKLNCFLILTLFVNFWANPSVHKFQARSLSGIELSFPWRGRPVILSFFSSSTVDDLQDWLQVLPLSILQKNQVTLLNIIYPGPGFSLIPPRRARKSLKNRIETEIDLALKDLNLPSVALYKNLQIHWIPDFRRRIFKVFGLDSYQSHIFLIDSENQLIGFYEGFSKIQALNLRLKLQKMAMKKG
jgi:hypothetical protein